MWNEQLIRHDMKRIIEQGLMKEQQLLKLHQSLTSTMLTKVHADRASEPEFLFLLIGQLNFVHW